MCAPYLEKSKSTFLPWFVKRSSIHLAATLSNFNRFQYFFCNAETGKIYKTGHAFTYLLLKESVANDVINVPLFAGPCVCCEPRHRRVEALRRLSAFFCSLLL